MVEQWRPARRKKKNSFWSWLAFVSVLVLLVFFAQRNISLYRQGREYRERAERLEAEMRTLEEQRSQLEAQAEATGEESFLERVALERLNLKRSGEEVIVFEIEPEEAEVSLEETELDFWEKLKATVGGWFRRQ
ncbi:MAG TPA: hypothetical protein PKX21_01135 [Candidatus Pacearchaeota archaeon]|nr:hypothetical protein [Candidatus Pacearchaeota archaeon]